jgi:hypothetical protein
VKGRKVEVKVTKKKLLGTRFWVRRRRRRLEVSGLLRKYLVGEGVKERGSDGATERQWQ